MTKSRFASRNLAMESVRITEAAALAAARLTGCGDEQAADRAAMEAMHEALKGLGIDGVIRIGEGTKEETPLLYVGEKAGSGDGPKTDVALMPLEGPTIIARGGPNGLAGIAMTNEGGFFPSPDVYMDKIAIGAGLPAGVVDLDAEPGDNIKQLAKARGVEAGELAVCILDRPRHTELIAKVREAGARIILIADGDLSGVIATLLPDSGIDAYMGIGGAPQGVLSAAALACVGGQMQGRLIFRNDDEKKRAKDCGIKDLNKKYGIDDMASGEISFAVTGVTGGAVLPGVQMRNGVAISHSMVLRSKSGTLRHIKAHHNFAAKVGS